MAARLFLSHKTAEVHLSHIYEKLGVHSRTSMVKLISSGAVEELSFPGCTKDATCRATLVPITGRSVLQPTPIPNTGRGANIRQALGRRKPYYGV